MMTQWRRVVVFAFASLCLGPAVHAAEQTLTRIENDRGSDFNQLQVVTDEQGLLRGLTYVSVSQQASPPSKTRKRFSLAQLASKKGVVLDGDSGHDVFILQGVVDELEGGDLVYRYLSNGMIGSYAECRIGLRRSSKGKWFVLDLSEQKPVTKAFIRTWALGIADVEGFCPRRK